MATLIAHSTEPETRSIANRLAEILSDQRGVTTAVEPFQHAARYLDNVTAVVVVTNAQQDTINRAARNFLNATFADLAGKSLFLAAVGTQESLTELQLIALEAYDPRDTAYFRSDALDEAALLHWAGFINGRGAV